MHRQAVKPGLFGTFLSTPLSASAAGTEDDAKAGFVCPVCHQRFSRRQALSSHMRWNHGETGDDAPPITTASAPPRFSFACPQCSYQCRSKIALEIHLERTHLIENDDDFEQQNSTPPPLATANSNDSTKGKNRLLVLQETIDDDDAVDDSLHANVVAQNAADKKFLANGRKKGLPVKDAAPQPRAAGRRFAAAVSHWLPATSSSKRKSADSESEVVVKNQSLSAATQQAVSYHVGSSNHDAIQQNDDVDADDNAVTSSTGIMNGKRMRLSASVGDSAHNSAAAENDADAELTTAQQQQSPRRKRRGPHADRTGIACPFCPYAGVHGPKHVEQSHDANGGGPFDCDIDGCACAFLTTRALEAHRHAFHHGQRRLRQCEHCQFTSYDLKDIQKHVKRSHSGDNFKCIVSDCNAVFTSSAGVKVHWYLEHFNEKRLRQTEKSIKFIKRHLRDAGKNSTKNDDFTSSVSFALPNGNDYSKNRADLLDPDGAAELARKQLDEEPDDGDDRFSQILYEIGCGAGSCVSLLASLQIVDASSADENEAGEPLNIDMMPISALDDDVSTAVMALVDDIYQQTQEEINYVHALACDSLEISDQDMLESDHGWQSKKLPTVFALRAQFLLIENVCYGYRGLAAARHNPVLMLLGLNTIKLFLGNVRLTLSSGDTLHEP